MLHNNDGTSHAGAYVPLCHCYYFFFALDCIFGVSGLIAVKYDGHVVSGPEIRQLP